MYRSLAILLITSLFYVSGFAQRTQEYTANINLFEHGKMLYLKQQYVPAIRDFEEFLTGEPEANFKYEATAYLELSRLHLDKKNAANNLADLVKDQPEHKLNKEIKYELGLYYFQEEKYKRALRYLEDVDARDLPKDKREELIFKKGYSYFIDEEHALAKAQFAQILNGSGKYAVQANYYYGYQCYILKEYQCALSTFERIGDKGPKTMKIYIAQIHYEQEEYEKAFAVIKDLKIESKEDDIELLKGKIQYQMGNYSIALRHFKAYRGSDQSLKDDEIFQFAHSYFLDGDYAKSTPYFLRIANLDNEIGQAANFHLGVSDVNNGEKARAMNAFAEARRKDFDPKITEIAAFNYAKLAAELKQNNVAINALRDFMETYPRSEYQNEAQNIMANIYLSTKNYKAAIAMIETIRNLDEGTKEAYQILTYHRAEELYLNGEFKESAIFFRKSLKYVKDRMLEAHAHFWLGEIAFKDGDYNEAIQEHFAFINNSSSSKSNKREYALYSLGYAYFKKNDFPKASQYFKQYSAQAKYNSNKPVYLDNQMRLADCHFLNRQYNDAIKAYEAAIKLSYTTADYALYQQGMLYGLVNKVEEKINTLRKIQKDFPRSVHVDDALFQIGREYLDMGNYNMAENMFKLIVSQHDYSKYLPESYLRLGLIYYNQEKDDIALGYYKTVVERFPNTNSSREALPYIKEILVRQGKSDEWLDYASRNGVDVRISDQDSTMYESAMSRYRSGDCPGAIRAFKNYLERFGDKGYFSIPVNYYKAECDFYNNRIDEALTHYEFVASRSTSEWSEKAVIKLAETYYARKQYSKSLTYYTKLEPLASSSANFLKAMMGQMRCYYLLNEYEKAKAKAVAILPMQKVPKDDLLEVNMTLGRIQLSDGNLRTAKFHFDYVIAESRNVLTAEALYGRAYIFFEQGQLDSSRTDIYLLNDDFSAYEFWVVKGFILLSDIYVKEKDYFQAKATLQSILDNYDKKDDGLLDICRMKLARIKELEKN